MELDNCDVGDHFSFAGGGTSFFLKLTEKTNELAKHKEVWRTVREAAHLQSNEDPFNYESGKDSDGDECAGEEECQDDDDTVSENFENGTTGISVEDADQEEASSNMRRRTIRHDAEHGAAEGERGERDGHDDTHGRESDGDDESFEEEETASQRYRRYMQSTMGEVSDPEEWSNIHYGYSHGSGAGVPEQDGDGGLDTERSRSRGSNEPTAKAMPRPLAKQVARNHAMETAMDMADAIDNSGPSASSSLPEAPNLENIDNSNYLLSSIPMANHFHILPVPREPLALDDYRWDLLGQGIGPEHLVVINCRNLSRTIPLMEYRMERYQTMILLRNFQNLLVMFQSGNPERWAEAADRVLSWIQGDRDLDVAEYAETEAGNSIYDDDDNYEEGEESERDDDNGSQPGDGPDRSGWDYDDGEGDRDGSSRGDLRGRVAGGEAPSSAAGDAAG